MGTFGSRDILGLICVGVLCALIAPASSQERDVWIDSCAIRADITGRLATTTIEHVYINQRNRDAEVTFRFRLPPSGSVHDLAMWIDGVRSPAVVYPRVTARRIYREIVERRRDPAILEYLGQGQWNLRVFPIPAHGSQKIELVCTHVMPVRGGRVVYESPQVVRAQSPADKLDFSARIRCPGGVKDLRAETHRMGVHAGADRTVQAGFRAEKQNLARPIALSFVPGQAADRVITWRDPDGTAFFWATLPPPAELFEGLLRKRNFVFVLDASASMSGWELRALKRAIGRVLVDLDPADQFALVVARSDVALWRGKLVPASRKNLAAARAHIAGLQAEGGTDLAAAFRAAESFNTDPAGPCYVLVLSDGDDVVGAKGLAGGAIRQAGVRRTAVPAANMQVHWFLTGSEEDDRAGLVPTRRGRVWALDRLDDFAAAAAGFHGAAAEPWVDDLALTLSGPKPMALRDLRSLAPQLDTAVVLTGRYAKGGDALVTLSATIDGRRTPWSFKLHVPDPPAPAELPWMGRNVSKLRAHLACDELWSRLQLEPCRLEDLERLVEISRQHHVVTRATAFLILENREAYVRRGIEPPGARLSKQESLSLVRRARAARQPIRGEKARRIAVLRKRAKSLRAAGEYGAAAKALDQVKRLDPTEYAACLEGSVLQEFVALRAAVRLARRERGRAGRIRWSTWHEMLQPTGVVSRIPAAGYVLPRQRARALPKLPEPDPAVVRKLRQRIAKLEFADIELKDVIEFLRQVTGVNIQVKWQALTAAGIDRTTAVSVSLANVTAEKALKVLVDDLSGGGTRIGYAIDEGVVSIAPVKDFTRRTRTVVYDVRDMIIRVPNFRGPRIDLSAVRGGRSAASGRTAGGGLFDAEGGEAGRVRGGGLSGEARRRPARPPVWAPPAPGGTVRLPSRVTGNTAGREGGLFDEDEPRGGRGAGGFFDEDEAGGDERLEDELKTRAELINEIITLLRETIDPTSWRAAGGEVGSVRELNGLLVVRQTLENHRALRDLVGQLRGARLPGAEIVQRTIDVELSPEPLFTTDAKPTPWVLELLRQARDKKLSKFSSVVVREVGRRTFARIGGIWFDCALTKASRVYLVKRGSLAADALIERAADLKPCFALGRSVIVALGANRAVSLDEIGITKPGDPNLKKLLAASGRGLP